MDLKMVRQRIDKILNSYDQAVFKRDQHQKWIDSINDEEGESRNLSINIRGHGSGLVSKSALYDAIRNERNKAQIEVSEWEVEIQKMGAGLLAGKTIVEGDDLLR